MSKPAFTVPRGMKDIETDEMAKRLWITDNLLNVLKKYGFQLVEPSPIENLETLEAKCGPSIKNEIYWFKDKARRALGLRFDLTVGLSRMVSNRYDLPTPIKLCAISNMWRYDEPQYARYRCFYQWDAEIFGSVEPEADAEIISVSMDILDKLGLKDYETRISNRKLAEGFLNSFGVISPNDIEQVLRIVDKFRKIPESQVTSELKKAKLNTEQIKKIIELASLKGKPDEILLKISKILPQNEAAKQGFNELVDLIEVLKAFKKIDRCLLDMSIVRGIGYYDGIVFEIYDKMREDIGAIVGGGRFDKLCEIYGKRDLPATGAAGGIERLMLSLEKANLIPDISQTPKVFVAAVNDSARTKVWNIVQELRNKGITVDFDLKKRSLTKQLEYTDSIGIPYAIIVGSKELERGMVKIRNMKKRVENEIKLEDLADKISILD